MLWYTVIIFALLFVEILAPQCSYYQFIQFVSKVCPSNLSVSISFLLSSFWSIAYEPADDKTNKMTYAPSEDSDQPGQWPSLICLRCPHEESLGPHLPSAQRRLIRLGGCPGWSESLLGVQVILWVLSWGAYTWCMLGAVWSGLHCLPSTRLSENLRSLQ